MPFASPKPCAYQGCPTLVKSGYCDIHRPKEISYHDPASQRLYNSARWRKFRIAYLSTHVWCVECLRANIYEVATDVDHIEPHRGDPIKFFRGPFQPLCHAHHSAKTQKEIQGRGGQ